MAENSLKGGKLVASNGYVLGEWLYLFDEYGRPRKFIRGHNPRDISSQVAFITACGDGSRLELVATRTGQSLQAAKCMATKLVQETKIIRKARGIYGRKN